MRKLTMSCLSFIYLFTITGMVFSAPRSQQSDKNPFDIMHAYESAKFNDLYDLVMGRRPLFIEGHLNCRQVTYEYLECNNLTIQDFIQYLEILTRKDLPRGEEMTDRQYLQARERAHRELAALQEKLRILEAEEATQTTTTH